MQRPLALLAALALSLSSGCFTKSLVDWYRESRPVESRVTQVMAWRASPQVVALRVVDLADDGVARGRDFWWVHGAQPGRERDEIARIASSSTMADFSSGDEIFVHVPQRLPLLPHAPAIDIVRSDAPPSTGEALVLHGDSVALWQRGERVVSVDLLATKQTRPPTRLHRVALGFGVPLTLLLDLATSPVQFVIAVVVFATHGGHLH